MMQSVFSKIGSSFSVFIVTCSALCAALACTLFMGESQTHLFGAFISGRLSQFGQALIIIIGLVTTLFFHSTFLKDKFFRGEIASLFLMVVAGMAVLVASEDLITVFVGLEMSSIGLYALVGYINPTRRSREGAVKYFVLGSFAAGLLLFGFGLIYASTGKMVLTDIIAQLPRVADHHWVRLGAVFVLAGLGFKLALVPFHLWAPDTYESAPTGMTAFMATGVKVMVLIFTARLFSGGMPQLFEVWGPGLTFLAILSMIFGNIMALVQTSLKRMLAYSSIAHSGYMAIAIAAMGGVGDLPVASILFYLVGYTIISMGAFGIIMWLESQNNDKLLLEDIAGFAKEHPWAAFALAVFMFAFAGMPPTVGFLGKFFVFNAALSHGLYALVIIGVIGSTISLYYYLRVIVRMYMSEPNRLVMPLKPEKSMALSSVIVAAVILVILFGTVLPGPMMNTILATVGEAAISFH
jgi:NADH-quinone oxidoreductase subunit N